MAEPLRQRHRGRRLAFARLRRRDRRDVDQLAVRLSREPVEDRQLDLRLVAAVRVDLVGLEPGRRGDLPDRPKRRLLRDLEGRRHRRCQIHPFGRLVASEDTTNISPWLVQAPRACGGEASSLADQAYYALRELIVSLELQPGRSIKEPELVARLGIGRTPVREALRRLAQERLIEVFPRRGMVVTTVDVRDLARLCEVRAALEPEAARLAAERATRGRSGRDHGAHRRAGRAGAGATTGR